MNIALLKSKMALHGDNQGELAIALGITKQTMSNKMIGKTEFKQSEIDGIAKRYQLNSDEIKQIFFNEVGV